MSEKKIRENAFDKLNDEQKAVEIPYYVHEGEMNRLERLNKRLWIILIVIFLAFVGTNAGWIIYESQFETYSYEQETKTDNAPAIGIISTGEGDVTYNGDGETKNPSAREEIEQQKPDEGMPDM